MNEIRKPRL